MGRILIIDDYKEIRDLFTATLVKCGYEVVSAETAKQGLETLQKEFFDLVLLDLLMPNENGIWLMDKLASQNIHPKIVLMGIKDNSTNNENLIQLSLQKGAVGFIDKRLSVEDELCTLIKTYLPK